MKDNIYIRELEEIFRKTESRYDAHKLSIPILNKMTYDKNFLFGIIKYNLLQPDYLEKPRHYSTLAMDIFYSADFHLVMNIFPALPNKDQSITFQNIHHHGSLLLTSAAAFGPGYSSYIFDKNYTIDPDSLLTKMSVSKFYKNHMHSIDFIDAWEPHVVFYPEDISATYALWSNNKKEGLDSFKNNSAIRKYKKQIVKLLNTLKLEGLFKLKKFSYNDFYTENKKLYALKNRINYEVGTNENFIQNIMHFIQKTGFDDYKFMKELMKKNTTNSNAKKWIQAFIDGEYIADEFEKIHLNVDKINLKKEDIEFVTNSINK